MWLLAAKWSGINDWPVRSFVQPHLIFIWLVGAYSDTHPTINVPFRLHIMQKPAMPKAGWSVQEPFKENGREKLRQARGWLELLSILWFCFGIILSFSFSRVFLAHFLGVLIVIVAWAIVSHNNNRHMLFPSLTSIPCMWTQIVTISTSAWAFFSFKLKDSKTLIKKRQHSLWSSHRKQTLYT